MIGQPQQIQGPQVDAASAAAARANGAQGNIFGAEGPERYEQSIFESLFRPVQRELGREGEIANRQLQAHLAGAGLASSGTGIGQQQQLARDYSQRTQDAATDASARAATARYQTQAEQEMLNAQLRQQTGLGDADRQQQVNLSNAEQQQQARLATANFSFEAQRQNAANVLSGDTARADSYLKTIGLNEETATRARSDFLNILQIAERDLARMEVGQRQTLDTMMNWWLQATGTLTDAGRFSEGTASSFGRTESGGVL